jgi:ubiquinone/menaquinone biosynthesis C-methylase UbiE
MENSIPKARLAYNEREQKLQVRIRAHERFSDFDLNRWLEGHLPLQPGNCVLDLGCGDGNHLALLQRRVGAGGLVVGVDKSVDLLSGARKRGFEASEAPVWLLASTFDSSLPFRARTFDACVSSFSIYYAASARSVTEELVRITRSGGHLVLLGPTAKNAVELYDFHYRVSGKRMTEMARERTDRLDREFLPLLQEVGAETRRVLLTASLVFPTPREFVEYYLATPLHDESSASGEAIHERLETLLPAGQPVRLNKEIACLECRIP